jgi:hypothetical protein
MPSGGFTNHTCRPNGKDTGSRARSFASLLKDLLSCTNEVSENSVAHDFISA